MRYDSSAMKSTLSVGQIREFSYRVPEDKTVAHVFEGERLFADMPPVFATAYLVGLIEWVCMQALDAHLEPGEQSVGTAIGVTHTAATPVGLTVKVTVRIVGVQGRRVRFEVRAEDDAELIGEGSHERFVIVRERFLEGVAKKRERFGQG